MRLFWISAMHAGAAKEAPRRLRRRNAEAIDVVHRRDNSIIVIMTDSSLTPRGAIRWGGRSAPPRARCGAFRVYRPRDRMPAAIRAASPGALATEMAATQGVSRFSTDRCAVESGKRYTDRAGLTTWIRDRRRGPVAPGPALRGRILWGSQHFIERKAGLDSDARYPTWAG